MTGVLVLVALVLLIAVALVVARGKARGLEPGRADAVSDEIVSRLMAELRKWQAEAGHWKATAERLQRELDRGQA